MGISFDEACLTFYSVVPLFRCSAIPYSAICSESENYDYFY